MLYSVIVENRRLFLYRDLLFYERTGMEHMRILKGKNYYWPIYIPILDVQFVLLLIRPYRDRIV